MSSHDPGVDLTTTKLLPAHHRMGLPIWYHRYTQSSPFCPSRSSSLSSNPSSASRNLFVSSVLFRHFWITDINLSSLLCDLNQSLRRSAPTASSESDSSFSSSTFSFLLLRRSFSHFSAVPLSSSRPVTGSLSISGSILAVTSGPSSNSNRLSTFWSSSSAPWSALRWTSSACSASMRRTHWPKSRVLRPQAHCPSCSHSSLLSLSSQELHITDSKLFTCITPAQLSNSSISSLTGTYFSTMPSLGKHSRTRGVNHSGHASFSSCPPGFDFPILGLPPNISFTCAQALATLCASVMCTFLASNTVSTTTGEAAAKHTIAPWPAPTTKFGMCFAISRSSVATDVNKSTRVAFTIVFFQSGAVCLAFRSVRRFLLDPRTAVQQEPLWLRLRERSSERACWAPRFGSTDRS